MNCTVLSGCKATCLQRRLANPSLIFGDIRQHCSQLVIRQCFVSTVIRFRVSAERWHPRKPSAGFPCDLRRDSRPYRHLDARCRKVSDHCCHPYKFSLICSNDPLVMGDVATWRIFSNQLTSPSGMSCSDVLYLKPFHDKISTQNPVPFACNHSLKHFDFVQTDIALLLCEHGSAETKILGQKSVHSRLGLIRPQHFQMYPHLIASTISSKSTPSEQLIPDLNESSANQSGKGAVDLNCISTISCQNSQQRCTIKKSPLFTPLIVFFLSENKVKRKRKVGNAVEETVLCEFDQAIIVSQKHHEHHHVKLNCTIVSFRETLVYCLRKKTSFVNHTRSGRMTQSILVKFC